MRAQYRRQATFGALTLASGLLLSACSGGSGSGAAPAAAPSATASAGAPAPATASPSAGAVDPAAVHADELGAVPVLMYHQIDAHPAGDYDQSPAQFRKEITKLYAEGYRTVTAADLVAGKVDVPAGKSPMVLTFDDSTVGQYSEQADGSVAPDSAVGILLDVAKAAGEDHPVATFYVNEHPFGGHDEYLAKLAAMGMEIGDHTATHANLRQLSAAGVQAEIVKGLRIIQQAAPDAQVTTFALPFGVHPTNQVLATKGSSGGTSYAFSGVMLVGSNPAPSPYNSSFKPSYVPRIRSGRKTGDQTLTSTYWLPRLASGSAKRYVSDGDPTHISFPKAEASRLAARFQDQARPY